MTRFAANLLFALGWALLAESLTLPMLALGFATGYLALWLVRPTGGDPYFRRLPGAIGLLFYFLAELVRSSLKVGREILVPSGWIRPGIVAVPLTARTDLEITLLANLVTLTPGTLSLAVSADRQTLYVHAMFIDSAEAVSAEIKAGPERRVLELLR